ncbi:MAG: hypothetical protein ACW98D_02920 [Promethearchaeota archaeon]
MSSRGNFDLELEFEYGKSQYEKIILTHSEFNEYFKDNFGELAIGFETIKLGSIVDNTKEKMIEMQDFVTDMLDFVGEMGKIAGEKIILYTFNIFENGYGIDRNSMTYLPNSLPITDYEWKPAVTGRFRDIGFVYDPNDPISIKNFEDQIPVYIANLLLKPTAFVVRIPGKNMEADECWFAFTPWGSLLPSQVVGHYTPSKASYSGPPRLGMKWSDGSEASYENSYLYNTWNKIVREHEIYGIHYFNDPSDFYNIVNRLGFIRNYRY